MYVRAAERELVRDVLWRRYESRLKQWFLVVFTKLCVQT